MARITGPLMSVDASGTYGKALTFGKWKGRNYVRERVIPANPRTAAQLGVRAMLGYLSRLWGTLVAPDKASWNADATARQITPFNAFVSANMQRWLLNEAPVSEKDTVATGGALDCGVITATGGAGFATLSIADNGASDMDATDIAIFRSAGAITAINWNQCVAIIPTAGGGPTVWTDSPLTAGTYHYRAALISPDGQIGPQAADTTATVT
jgi:hypothetical protein